jgi:hypothetical protein
MEASSLLNNTTPLESSTSISLSNDNKINDDAADSAVKDAGNLDNSSERRSTTISKDELEKSPTISTQINDQHAKLDSHNDSSIKLKRCKHGRIIIKDLSKKKLAQSSDNGSFTMNDTHSNESNNNHAITKSTPNDNGNEIELNQSSSIDQSKRPDTKDLDVKSRISDTGNPKPTHSPSKQQPCTQSNEPNPAVADSGDQISQKTDKRGSDRLILRARAWSRSSNESLSPPRVTKSTRSPLRRSRYSRSPARSERSPSRDRIRRSSGQACDSPGPRRRNRSSSRRRRRRERRRSSSRRQRRTPDRHRRYRDSSRCRTPNRELPRSRSVTPSRHRSTSRRRSHRNASRSVSKEPSRCDKYSHINYERSRERTDKAPYPQSPVDNRRSRADVKDSTAVESYISINQNDKESLAAIKHNVAQSNTESSLGQIIATHQPSQQKFNSPEQARVVETSSAGLSAAPSPATPPSNDDSASSDIYDPAGPIIPISPCDSPPISPIANAEPSTPEPRPGISEKTGDDDVPSSAVQLNQQEKYLQKLNRQERVIEEVKVALRPFYQDRSIDKEQYKDVLRRAVPKICHSKNGEINPIKIRALVAAYVKKMKRH